MAVATPFWKLRVSREEFEDIVSYIKFYLDNNHYRDKKTIGRAIGRELCLLYAYWWGNDYSGGNKNYNDALEKYGISLDYRKLIIDCIYDEIKYRKRLDITLYRGKYNNLYLESVTAQGGLPLRLFKKDDLSSYEIFLDNLISEYEEVAERDWEDLSKAQELAQVYLHNKTLRESKEVLEFAMEITKAYLDGNFSYFDDYAEIKELVNRIREKRVNRSHQNPKYFHLTWMFKILPNNNLDLNFSVRVPSILEGIFSVHNPSTSEGLIDDDIISYFIEGIMIGSYHRNGNKYVLMPGTSSSAPRRCKTTSRLKMQRKIGSSISLDNTITNADLPYMGEPFLVQYFNGSWIPKSLRNVDDYGCIIPEGWECELVSDAIKLTMNTQCFYLWRFQWGGIDSNEIKFINRETGEIVILTKAISEYSVSLVNKVPEWLEESNSAILFNCDNLSASFRKLRNNESYSGLGFRYYYKMKWEQVYHEYAKEMIPTGPLTVRVMLPDRQMRTFAFFSINGLSYNKEGNDTFTLTMRNGYKELLNGQNNISIVEGETDKYALVDNTTQEALKCVRFRIASSNHPIDSEIIGVSSPHNAKCFIDNHGNIMRPGDKVSYSQLFKYKVNLDADAYLKLSFYKENMCYLRQSVKLSKGKTTLDILTDWLEQMISIVGFNDNYNNLKVQIVHTDMYLIIMRNTFVADVITLESGDNGLIVKQNGKSVPDLTLYACPVQSDTDNTELFIMKEIDSAGGVYYISDEDKKKAQQFVVFTDNRNPLGKLKPKFLNVVTDDFDRNKHKGSSIENITEALLKNDEEAWNEVWTHTKYAIKYHLPYLNSFNCFQAIASCPQLQASFITKPELLKLGYDSEIIINELKRMEMDLAICFYNIPQCHWQVLSDTFINEYNDLIQANSFLKEISRFSSSEEYLGMKFKILLDMLTAQFGEELGMLVSYKLIKNVQLVEETIDENLVNIHPCTEYDNFNTPSDLVFPHVDFYPNDLMSWKKIVHLREGASWRKHRYLSIVIPQLAVTWLLNDSDDLWAYNKSIEDFDERNAYNERNAFFRRINNYLRTYDTERYNNLFIATLLKTK